MNIILDNIFSIFVYLSSFSIIAYLISMNGQTLSKWKRASLVLIASLIILGIAALELPLSGIPFWSRDFSLTWQLMVLCLAIIASSFHLTLKGIDSSYRPFFIGRIRERIRFSKIIRDNEVGEINEPARSRISLDQYLTKNGTGMSRNRAYLLISVGVVFLFAYLIGAYRQLLVNRDMEAKDQSAYMNYAKDMAITDYSYIGTRNRMPLYPFIQSFLYDEAIDYHEFFLRGKYLNVLLSVFILIGLKFLLNKYFNLLWSGTIVLVTAFSIFIFKAGWFQTELLFYLLNFILFLLMLEYLARPSLALSVWIGIAAGYAHLTKASILPGLVILLLIIFVMNIRAHPHCEKYEREIGTPKSWGGYRHRTTSHYSVLYSGHISIHQE